MYSLVSAIVKEVNNGIKWKSMDISSIDLKTLFATYQEIYANLFSDTLNKNIDFDVSTIKNEYNQSTITLVDYLTANGENTLAIATGLPILSKKVVKYAHAAHAGYSITPIFRANGSVSTMPSSWKTWLKLNKSNVTPAEFHRYCMVSVNGYFHLIDHDENNIYVIDGNKGRQICNDNKLGIYTFSDVGALTYIPIKEPMVVKAGINIPLYSKAIINTSVSMANKTPILVMGGYMVMLDSNVFDVISDNEIMIDFNNYGLLEKYYESSKFMNLDSLGLTIYKKNESLVDYEEFYTDDVIKKYLTLSQSFIVLVDNPAMYVDRFILEREPVANAYRTTIEPTLPLMLGYGRIAEYWYLKNEKHYYITVQNNVKENFLFRTTDPMEEISSVDSRYPYKVTEPSAGYFLEIGSTIKGNL